MAKPTPNANENVVEVVISDEVSFVSEQVASTRETLNSQHEKFVTMANALLSANKLDEAQKAINFLSTIEERSKIIEEKECFDTVLASETPYEMAAEVYFYESLGHKVKTDKNDGHVISVEGNKKQNRIALTKLAKYADGQLPTIWLDYAQKFNQLLCIKHATELGADTARIKLLSTNFFMRETAKKIDMGKTPTSKTQLVKMLQKVIDQLIFKPSENNAEENAYKVNNYDVAFIEETFGKLNKKAKMTVSFAKNDELCNLLLDVILRLTTNGKYDFDAKMKS